MNALLFSSVRSTSRRSSQIWSFTRLLSTAEASLSANARELPVYASCVLARAPVIKPKLEDWERDYNAWAEKIRARKLRPVPPEWEKTKKTVAAEEGDSEQSADIASQWNDVPRETEADHTGDVKSLMRCLDRYLYFIVKAPSGVWSFPSTENRDGETIRQTGERALAEGVVPGVDAFFIANWPIAHYAFREDALPRTEYYMKAQLLSGHVTLPESGPWRDYAWIPKSEVPQYFVEHPKLAQLLTRAFL